MKILILYTRLSGYFIEALNYFISENPNSDILCIAYPSSGDAPFVYPQQGQLNILIKSSFSDSEILSKVNHFNPTSIYVAGWSDSLYKKISKFYVSKVPVIMGMDNPWKGSIRQRIGVIYGRVTFKKYFNKIWVAGILQYELARRLGYKPIDIKRGLYCGNDRSFSFLNYKREKTILYVGRFVSFKRPEWLLKAFKELVSENKNFEDWQVRLIGNGPLKEELRSKYGKDKNFDFVDFTTPELLPLEFSKVKLFCLPSSEEHWGVVVHEAAISGLPLLLSDSCGAATEFLISGYNGMLFKNNDFDSFKSCLKSLILCSEEEFNLMSLRSHELSKRITLETWCATFKELVSSGDF